MISAGQYGIGRLPPAEILSAAARPSLDKSATRIDIALLVSVLFLQRFSLPFGNTFLHLDLEAVCFILLYQVLSGKLVIQYDRFLWFLALGLAASCSLLLNFNSTMLTGYSQFLVVYSLFTLSRPPIDTSGRFAISLALRSPARCCRLAGQGGDRCR
jgi:hypothetical protein